MHRHDSDTGKADRASPAQPPRKAADRAAPQDGAAAAGSAGLRKFPRTPHVVNLGAATRDDLVMSAADAAQMLRSPQLTVEEKVDGSNLGVSFDPETFQLRFQKRSHWVTPASEAQYAKLDTWAAKRHASLWRMLGTTRVLYGEWLAAVHTVAYDSLPDWFLAFDIYDSERRGFVCRSERDRLLNAAGIHAVRVVHAGPVASVPELVAMLSGAASGFCTQFTQAEGFYLRVDDADSGQVAACAKLVHPGFIQAIEAGHGHWSHRATVNNVVRSDLWEGRRNGDEHEIHAETTQPQLQSEHARDEEPHCKHVPPLSPPRPRSQYEEGASIAAPPHSRRRAATQPPQSRQGLPRAPAPAPGSTLAAAAGARAYVSLVHGTVSLVGDGVDAAARALAAAVPLALQEHRARRFGKRHHLTLVTHDEVAVLTGAVGAERLLRLGAPVWPSAKAVADACAAMVDVAGWVALGHGRVTSGGSEAHFCAAAWPSGAAARAHLGLSQPQPFHVTVGFLPRDVHTALKGTASVLRTAGSSPLPGGSRAVLPCAEDLLSDAAHARVAPRDAARAAAALVLQAAVELQGSPCDGDSAAALADVGRRLAVAARAHASRTADEAAAVVAASVCAAAEAMSARMSGRAGDMLACLANADAAVAAAADAAACGAAGGAAPFTATHTGSDAVSSLAAAAVAYAYSLKAKALFSIGRVADAGDAFRAALCAATLSTTMTAVAAPRLLSPPHMLHASSPTHELPRLDTFALLAHALRKLFDAEAARRGAAACTAVAEPPGGLPQDDNVPEQGSRQSALPGGGGPVTPRSRYTVPSVLIDGQPSDVQLMRNTSWLVPGELMGSSTPKRRDQILALGALGVRLVITLTEEEPLPPAWFAHSGVENLFVPVPNYEPPSKQQMDAIMAATENCISSGGAVLVHCGGGKGRAGTALACYMCKHGLGAAQQHHATTADAVAAATAPAAAWSGTPRPLHGNAPAMSASEAVATLRAMRPGSIETSQQQRFVLVYLKLLWKRHSAQAMGADCMGPPPDVGRQPADGHPEQQHCQMAHPPRCPRSQWAEQEACSPAGCAPLLATAPEGCQPAVDTASSTQLPTPTAAASTAIGNGGGSGSPPSKYPRTPHLPFSPAVAQDDVTLCDADMCSELLSKGVVVTEKLDGGNCMVFQGRVFGRTLRQEATHPSFGMVKEAVACWSHLVPPHLALFAENMVGVHSIEYYALTSPLYIIAAYNCQVQEWVSWDEVVSIAGTLGVPTVPLLFRGSFRGLADLRSYIDGRVSAGTPSVLAGEAVEGFVVRCAGSIPHTSFGRCVAKYVREGHVQTSDDWARTWRQAHVLTDSEMPDACAGIPDDGGIRAALPLATADKGRAAGPPPMCATPAAEEDEHALAAAPPLWPPSPLSSQHSCCSAVHPQQPRRGREVLCNEQLADQDGLPMGESQREHRSWQPTPQHLQQPAQQAQQRPTEQQVEKQLRRPALQQAGQQAKQQPRQPSPQQARQRAKQQSQQPPPQQAGQQAKQQPRQPSPQQAKQRAKHQPQQPILQQAKEQANCKVLSDGTAACSPETNPSETNSPETSSPETTSPRASTSIVPRLTPLHGNSGGRKVEVKKASAKLGGGRDKALNLPKLLFLVGLPGSGKSTFADALVASGHGWSRVCQDECGGSRRTTESAFGIAALRGGPRSRVILDRCNATASDRRAWMALACVGKRDKGVAAVHFDVPADECIRRVQSRQGHPTLPPHRGAVAIASFAKVLEPPTVAQGFSHVYTVRSFEDADALIRSFGAQPPELPAEQATMCPEGRAGPGGAGGAEEWAAAEELWQPRAAAQGSE